MMSEQINTDALTNAYNRRTGAELLLAELSALKGTQRTLVLCSVEIANLKRINDEFGHEAGDACLTKICDCLQDKLHENGILFRSSGDTFAVVLPDATLEEADAYAYAVTDMLYAFNEKQCADGYLLKATFGCVQCDANETRSPKQLLSSAELREFRIRTP